MRTLPFSKNATVFPLSRLAARMRPMGSGRHDGAYRKRGQESRPDRDIALAIPGRREPTVAGRVSHVSCSNGGLIMPDDFEYISRARLEYQGAYRHAYLGEVAEPVVYGVQGALREYYGAKEGPPIASTLDHIVAAVAG